MTTVLTPPPARTAPVPPSTPGPSRVMVAWCPDWPVLAAAAELGLAGSAPIAVIEAGAVRACSEPARRDGVRRGMRRRDATAHCPELVLVPHSPERDARTFETVLGVIEQVSASVTPIRPGLCALAVPSRFYGGEAEAAAVVAERLVAEGVWDCRLGIADSIFTAEQAARQAPAQDSVVVPAGKARAFLSPLPVGVLEEADQVSLFRRLGLKTLGDLAALPARDVATRFGARGSWLHQLARGADPRPAVARRPPWPLDQHVDFTPGLETIEPIVFSTRQTAERFVAELSRHGLVCTEVLIEVDGDRGWSGSRVWAHPRWFQRHRPDRPALLAAAGRPGAGAGGDRTAGAGVGGVARRPRRRTVGQRARRADRPRGGPAAGSARPRAGARPVPAGRPQPGFAARLDPLGGAGGPATAGRAAVAGQHSPTRPGPGLRRASAGDGAVGGGSAGPGLGPGCGSRPKPARLRLPGGSAELAVVELAVDAWAGPWPIDELWWDPQAARAVARFQFVAVDGSAWLLIVEHDQWWVEGAV